MKITIRAPPMTPPTVPPMILALEFGDTGPEGRAVVVAVCIIEGERDPVEGLADGTGIDALNRTKEGLGIGE